MKKFILCSILILASIKVLNAQYTGGNGNGDSSDSINNAYIYIHKISNNIPDKNELSQNYPNPFNPATNIKYQITNSSLILLKVYNISGKEIITLVKEKQLPGTYEVNWEAREYPSGIYFYRLESENFSEIKKMILIK